jgi:hypothetical protein
VILSTAPGSVAAVSTAFIISLAVLITVPISVTDGDHVGVIDRFIVEISSPFSALLSASEVIRAPLSALTVVAGRAWFFACGLRHQPSC